MSAPPLSGTLAGTGCDKSEVYDVAVCEVDDPSETRNCANICEFSSDF